MSEPPDIFRMILVGMIERRIADLVEIRRPSREIAEAVLKIVEDQQRATREMVEIEPGLWELR